MTVRDSRSQPERIKIGVLRVCDNLRWMSLDKGYNINGLGNTIASRRDAVPPQIIFGSLQWRYATPTPSRFNVQSRM